MISLYVKKEIKEDETIIFDKITFNQNDFEIIEKDNQIIVKPKTKIIKIVSLNDFDVKTNFKHSEITSCFINDKRPSNNKYMGILKDVYKIINSGKIITKKTKLNYEIGEKNDKGFEYFKDLSISIQHKEAKGTLEEIFNQCIENNIKLEMDIKFDDGKITRYVISH